MNDELAFRQAILTNPEDDTVRLVYADWLQEQSTEHVKCPTCNGAGVCLRSGRESQFEIPRGRNEVTVYFNKGKCLRCDGSKVILDEPKAFLAEFIRVQCQIAHLSRDDIRLYDLKARESQLLYYGRFEWFLFKNNSVASWEYSRGFVDSIRCNASDWLSNASDIYWSNDNPCALSHHPIRFVHLTCETLIDQNKWPLIKFTYD